MYYSLVLTLLVHCEEYQNITGQSFPVFIYHTAEHFHKVSRSLWKIRDPSDIYKCRPDSIEFLGFKLVSSPSFSDVNASSSFYVSGNIPQGDEAFQDQSAGM